MDETASDVASTSASTRQASYFEELLEGDKYHVSGNARKDLIKWCSFPWEDPPFHYSVSGLVLSDAWTYMVCLGGIERVSSLVSEYTLDPDGTGVLDEEKLQEREEYCLRLIDQTLNFLVNPNLVHYSRFT